MPDTPQLVQGVNAEFIPTIWDGKDSSGIRCVGTTVLVLMDACSPRSSGGIEFPADIVEKFTFASERGVLAVIGDGAFLLNEDMSAWSGPRPIPGDRVYIEKFAGKQIRGVDGKVYRLMSYQNIGAIYKTKAEMEALNPAPPVPKKGKKNVSKRR